MKKSFTNSLAVLCLSLPCIASATLLDFSYLNLDVDASSTQNSVNMTAEGLTVNVTAYTIENDGLGNISSLSQLTGDSSGVFVSGSASGNLGVRSYAGEGTLLDGGSTASDSDEGLLFSFSELVSFDFIDFDYFTETGGDNFNLTVDGVTILLNADSNNPSDSSLINPISGKSDEFIFSSLIGKEFLFWADENSDSFYIDKIQVTAVPAPATLLLFIIGVLGLPLWKKKYKNA